MTNIQLPIRVLAIDNADLQQQLDEAVDAALKHALQNGGPGILVTKHDFRSFTVDLSGDVPFGLTRERELA